MTHDDLVLCRGTVAGASFRELAESAAAAGFAAISLFGHDCAQARTNGLSDADMRTVLDDNGLEIAELDPLLTWLPEPSPGASSPAATCGDDEANLYAIADVLGARSLNVCLVTDTSHDVDGIAEAFAGVCDRAAEHGLLAHLEFLPWTPVADAETALEIVRRAGHDNGGVMFDTWHYFRGGGDAGGIGESLASRVFAIQINDAPKTPADDIIEETLRARLLPGEGAIGVAGVLQRLRAGGCTAPVGVEVFSDELAALPPREAARRAGDAARRVVAASHG